MVVRLILRVFSSLLSGPAIAKLATGAVHGAVGDVVGSVMSGAAGLKIPDHLERESGSFDINAALTKAKAAVKPYLGQKKSTPSSAHSSTVETDSHADSARWFEGYGPCRCAKCASKEWRRG